MKIGLSNAEKDGRKDKKRATSSMVNLVTVAMNTLLEILKDQIKDTSHEKFPVAASNKSTRR